MVDQFLRCFNFEIKLENNYCRFKVTMSSGYQGHSSDGRMSIKEQSDDKVFKDWMGCPRDTVLMETLHSYSTSACRGSQGLSST